MWRKIHSNRDPRDTLYSEVQKEFGTYFKAAGQVFKELLNAYPKLCWMLMTFFMVASAVLSFTVFRRPEPKSDRVVRRINSVDDGFSKILKTASKIREGMRLKKMVDSLSAKEKLSSADSTVLENALDNLQKLQR